MHHLHSYLLSLVVLHGLECLLCGLEHLMPLAVHLALPLLLRHDALRLLATCVESWGALPTHILPKKVKYEFTLLVAAVQMAFEGCFLDG